MSHDRPAGPERPPAKPSLTGADFILEGVLLVTIGACVGASVVGWCVRIDDAMPFWWGMAGAGWLGALAGGCAILSAAARRRA